MEYKIWSWSIKIAGLIVIIGSVLVLAHGVFWTTELPRWVEIVSSVFGLIFGIGFFLTGLRKIDTQVHPHIYALSQERETRRQWRE
jgi:hypothetical protein